MKIAAIVVLYNPKKIEEVISNISSFYDDLDRLILIDNTDIINFNENILTKNFDKAIYKGFGENLGIARALNEGCKIANNLKFTHVLTMDQDSYFLPNHFNKLLQTTYINDVDCAIITPFHSVNKETPANNTIKSVNMCMTSGNILSLSAYKRVDGFLDKLFIDYVDYEFCGKLKKKRFLIYENSNSILIHQLGSLSIVKFINKKFNLTNHSPERRYYRTRNFLYFFKKNIIKNPTDTLLMLRQEIIDFLLLILFEKNRLKKIKGTILGFFDFLIGKYEKISYKL